MKFLILLSIIFALSFVAYEQDAFAAFDCNAPHCYSLVRYNPSIDGIEYELDSPDLWMSITDCDTNIAVSTGWMVADTLDGNDNPMWAESGVTKGYVENVGCVTVLSTYYAFNTADGPNKTYQEFLIPNGRVDPGDDVNVTLQRNSLDTSQVQIFLTTPDLSSTFPIAQVTLHPDNVYFADFGIEGTLSANDDYSTIPMSKFTNMKIKENSSWINLPNTAFLVNDTTGEGYIGQKCSDTSFVAGSVMSPLDCNVVATTNQIPLVDNQIINIATDAPFTINLDDVDTDQDYLHYVLLSNPTSGTLDFFNVNSRIPNTDGDSAELVYTPASATPDSDSFLYSVTDKRDGHTREGLITIIGPVPEPSIPDPVDDFSHTLNGITINFDWSEPFDGGSEIENYKVERSVDTVTWNLHDWFTETSFSYERYEGYDHYFRVFANNANGLSASSNVISVHIADTTPPSITINNPTNGETLLAPDVFVDGFIYEAESSGIEDVKIWLDNILRPEFPTIDIILLDTSLNFESLLSSVSNGNYLLMVTAENGDGVLGSDNISITVDAPIPTQLDLFEDNFEIDMSNWYLVTEDDEYWSVRESPIISVPNSSSENKVAGTEDCDDVCTMTMVDYVDLSQMASPTLSFYRYVSTSADIPGEGIIVNVSEDNGNTWIVLDSFIADESDDDGLWHQEEYDLSIYSTSTQFKLKFEAISTSNSEDTELDDIQIYDASADTTPPVITLLGDNPQIIEVGTGYTELGSTTDDGSLVIINATAFVDAIGSYSILYDSVDTLGNVAIQVIRIVDVVDTTPPVITVPADVTFEATAIFTPLNQTDYGTATTTDVGDPFPVISNDAPIEFSLGNTTIIWTATDFSGNNSTDNQLITVQDTINPSITLLGDNPQTIELGDTYAELGANATDNIDGNITVNIIIDSSAVNTDVVGSYPVMYDVSDFSGNSAVTESREVIVIQSNPAPIIISLVVDDPDDLDQTYSIGDTLTITFDSDTNIPGGTGIQTKTTIDDMFTFSESLGRAYNGKWITPDTFTITIKSETNAGPPVINNTVVVPSGIIPILSSDELSEPSSATSPALSGDFGIIP